MLRLLISWIVIAITTPLRWALALCLRWRFGQRGVVRLAVGAERKPIDTLRLARLLQTLHRIAEDPFVRVLRVDLRMVPMGWAAAQAFRTALSDVGASGKHVVVHMDSADDRALFVASAADRVTMPPCGELVLDGICTSLPFFGDAIRQTGIVVEMESAGAFKSFGESYTRAFPTSENRLATTSLLQDLSDQVTQAITDARGLGPEVYAQVASQCPVSVSKMVDAGLIDAAMYADQLDAALEEQLGGAPRTVSFAAYLRIARMLVWLEGLGRGRPKVVVLHLQGPIVGIRAQMGRPSRMIVADEVVPVLDGLVDTPAVEAVVLRIDSPGGSALASDLIARSVARLGAHKPVVVSMGNVAASGGYYIAARAAAIVAHPATITGSIGVVGGKVVIGPALARFGVHTEHVGGDGSGPLLGGWSTFTPEQRRGWRRSLERIYARFIRVVSGGRHQPISAIEAVAEGRVWTGTQALAHGLVDQMGGLADAIARVQMLIGAQRGPVRTIHHRFDPPRLGWLGLVMNRGQVDVARLLLHDMLGPHAVFVDQLIDAPGESLMIEPAVWDSASWRSWV